MKRTLIAILCVILMVSAVSVHAFASAVDDTIQPLWNNTANIDCTFNFHDGIGYADSVTKAQFGASSITTDIYVYKQINGDWIYVTELHDTKNKMVSGVSCIFNAESGVYYRADYTFTVTKNNVAEVIHRTLYNTCP